MIQSSRHEEYSISRPQDHDDGPDGCNYKAITLTENRPDLRSRVKTRYRDFSPTNTQINRKTQSVPGSS